jgi:hypothetical protein
MIKGNVRNVGTLFVNIVNVFVKRGNLNERKN